MKITSQFTHPQVVPNLYDFLSSAYNILKNCFCPCNKSQWHLKQYLALLALIVWTKCHLLSTKEDSNTVLKQHEGE